MEKIKHLEELSMLELSEDERKTFKKEFDTILDFVSEITHIDLEYINDDYKGLNLNEFREDKVSKSIKREDALLNAPKTKDGCFVTPMVIE